MAVGDAVGLPFEGISKGRQHRCGPDLTRHHFCFGRGMVSDDTEHACMTAQAVIASGGDPDRFACSLAWRMRLWLLGLPAGIGGATLRGMLRLWMGFSPERSGVDSAGNGPSMRSPILGVLFAHDWGLCRELVRRSTIMTHTDPVALHCALAVAVAAGLAVREPGLTATEVFPGALAAAIPDAGPEFIEVMRRVVESAGRGESTEDFALSMGLERGVSGYSLHSVPVAVHAWLSHPMDYAAAVTAAIQCGGDTDTTAAIAGGIVGAAVGRGGIPPQWLDGLLEWPCGVAWMERLAERSVGVAESREPGKPVVFNVPGQFLRNLFFLGVVLIHGFRRLLPPY